jgi:tRNA dimethylallyltransferase
MNNNNKLIVIAGATASGKSAYAVEAALKIGGEIVSADSMQVYEYMDIGTAKVTEAEKKGVPHYMLGVVSPFRNYSVNEYAAEAGKCIDDILKKGKTPILAGGTGLYINSVIYNFNLKEAESDPGLRRELTAVYNEKGGEFLLAELGKFDPETAARLHPNNSRRIIRAIEMYKTSGITMSRQRELTAAAEKKYDFEYYCLNPARELLYERINRRVDAMFEKGLAGEVRRLIEMGVPRENTAMQALGYKETAAYLDGCLSLDEAVYVIKRETRRYAKRQLTWFRRDKNVRWIEV